MSEVLRKHLGERIYQIMFKRIVLIIIVLCSVDFYTLIYIPEVIQKSGDIIAIGLIIAFLILMYFYDRSKPLPKSFIFPIVLIFISVTISMLAAYGLQDQGIPITLWSQRAIYYYLLYFLLSRLRPDPEFIMKLVIYMGAAYMIIYIAQSIVYPYPLLSYKLFFNRGTLRIFMPGAGYYQLGYYLCLYLFFRDYKISNLLYIVAALVVTVLIGSRQLLASIVLVSLLFLVLNQVVKAKFALLTLAAFSLIPLYLLFQDIFNAMLEVTSAQSEYIEDNIRVRAAKFFLTDFLNSPIAYLTGNGMNGNHSLYGLNVQRYALKYGFYQSDVGLVGDYVKYGLLFIVGVIITLIKVLKAKLPDKSIFVKYFFLGITMMMFTGGSIFANSDSVVILCLIFYIIDSKAYLKNSMPEDKSKLLSGPSRTPIQDV